MKLILRQAVVTDLPAIYRGEQSYIRSWEPEHEASWNFQFEKHLTRWVENFDRLTIAVMGDQFAGYSLWTQEHNYAELCTINVDANCRRSGVGTALLAAYALDAKNQGFSQLRLSVRADNPARLMYERFGFVHTGTGAHGYLTYERCV
ncbi:GNAT family N-acetyltransferase [Pseudomonas graminis]|uniref:GNAT family N-acetyltransferase n=1 Tax=Pseudomonas graminis TaxID=158627 RepID=UPI00105D4877|nr:GNAT family N-acetyltransferase [Pseudomonas graminis]